MNRDAWTHVNREGVDLAKVVCQRFSPIETGPYRTQFWAIQCYSSRVEVILPEQRFVASPGTWTIMPPKTTRTFRFLEQCQHRTIHFWANALVAPDWTTVLLHAGDRADELERMHAAALQAFPTERARAEATVRHLLWELTDCFADDDLSSILHPAVAHAITFIEENYTAPLTVADAVHHACVSHNHLTSLFRRAFGMTIVEYIRDRRTREAKYLLQQTDMPIKQIAIEVGIPDLQHFNRTIHRQFSCSPRALRSEQ